MGQPTPKVYIVSVLSLQHTPVLCSLDILLCVIEYKLDGSFVGRIRIINKFPVHNLILIDYNINHVTKTADKGTICKFSSWYLSRLYPLHRWRHVPYVKGKCSY